MTPANPRKQPRGSALPDFVLRQFDRGHPEFDHRQLYLILQSGMRESVLPAGTRLPPSRTLAQALGIARNTVVHVYEQLALEGYVLAQVGRGTFVADMGQRLVPVATPAPDPVSATPRKNLSRRGRALVDDAGGIAQHAASAQRGAPSRPVCPR